MSAQQQLPPGLTPISSAFQAYQFGVAVCAYSASLVPIILALVLFSSASLKKTAVFWLLLLCLLFGVIQGFLSFAEDAATILRPLENPDTGTFLMTNIILIFLPLFTDATLIFKLQAFYPTQLNSMTLRWGVVALPIALFIARLGVASAFMSAVNSSLMNDGYLAALTVLGKNNLLMAEFILQFVDNCYCSGFLLFKGYQFGFTHTSMHRSSKTTAKARTWLQATLASFVIPCCLQIVLIGTKMTNISTVAKAVIQYSNVFVSLHCAVLATLWSTIRHPGSMPDSATSSRNSSNGTNSAIRGQTTYAGSTMSKTNTLDRDCEKGSTTDDSFIRLPLGRENCEVMNSIDTDRTANNHSNSPKQNAGYF